MKEFNPVLMVIDVQNGFVTDASAHVVPVIINLVRRWQEADEDVIFTRYYNYPGSPFERLIGWYGLQAPPETELVNDLTPFTRHPRAHVIDKKVYTAFTDEGRQFLAKRGYTDLFICGIATDGCILKTTLDAFELGYTPWVLADAVASNASSAPPEKVHSAALLIIPRLVGAGQMIDSESALARLPVVAEHPSVL